MKKIYLAITLILATYYLKAQQPGNLDLNFGENGKIYYSNLTAYSNAVEIQPDGKIIIGGYSNIANNSGTLITRLNIDGSIDNEFAQSGNFILHEIQNNKTYQAVAVKLQTDNKIVACARFVSSENSAYNVGVIRLKTNGSLDSSFGDNGVVIVDINKYDEIGNMLIQKDGKILITGNTGSSESAGNPEFLMRFLANGEKDNLFGDDGLVTTSYSSAIKVHAIVQQKDEKILTASNYGISVQQYQVVRYNLDGKLDTDFGTNGFARLIPVEGTFQLNDMIIQDDDKIVCAGGWSIIRFNLNGTPDTSFGGGDGYTLLNMPSGYADIKNVFKTVDNKILTTGHYQDGEGTGVAAILYQANGKLDSSFGVNGLAISGFDNLNQGTDMTSGAGAIQDDGKIVISGSFPNNEDDNYNISVFRFIGVSENRFVRLKKWLHRHGFTWEDWPGKKISYYSVQRSGNGNNFNEIARLFNRNNQQQFTFTDGAPLTGDNYYRLAAVNADDAVAYSNILSIPNNEVTIKIYPNPAKNNLVIEGLPTNTKAKLVITDLNGVARLTTVVSSKTYNLNISNLKQGNYVLQVVVNGNNIATKKFIKE